MKKQLLKSLLLLALSLIMILCVVSCNDGNSDKEEPTNQATEGQTSNIILRPQESEPQETEPEETLPPVTYPEDGPDWSLDY